MTKRVLIYIVRLVSILKKKMVQNRKLKGGYACIFLPGKLDHPRYHIDAILIEELLVDNYEF